MPARHLSAKLIAQHCVCNAFQRTRFRRGAFIDVKIHIQPVRARRLKHPVQRRIETRIKRLVHECQAAEQAAVLGNSRDGGFELRGILHREEHRK